MKYLIIVTSLVLVLGCSKGTDSAPNITPTKASLLTAKEWVLVSSQYKSTTATIWTDQFALMPACDKDDKLQFKVDGTYELNEGASKCNASNPFIIQTGTWKFALNETILAITEISGTTPTNRDATIDALSATTLGYTYIKTVTGVQYTIKEVYGH